MRTELIILEGERPKSWNEFWSGMHWSARKKYKDRAKLVVRSAIDPNSKPFDVPVRIRYDIFMDKHLPDIENICTKPYTDGLIGWLIVDDSPKYVPKFGVELYADKENPRMEILITPA